MGENDGGVRIPVKLDPDDAAKEFDKLSRKAQGLEEKLARSKAQLKAATDEAMRLGAQLDAAKAKQAEMEASGSYTKDQIKQQAETVASLQARYNAADRNAEKMAASVAKTNTELTATKEKAAQAAKEMGRGGSALGQMDAHMKKVENRLKRLATRVLFFSVFTTALRSLRSWLSDVVKTDKDAVAAMAQLKGALLTLVQPLVGVVIPAFTAFVQVLTQAVGAIASVVSSIFGTTVEESAEAAENLNDEKKALDGVGSSAKKAGKSLASFDEINKLSGDGGASGAGAGTKGKEIAPDFSFMDGVSERLQDIAKWVLLIGAGFALWKIGLTIGGELGSLLQTLGLIAIAVGGLILFFAGLKDAWENGVDWLNAAAMVGGLAAAVFALSKLFGPLAGEIALALGGIILFITGIKDAWENGLNWANAALMIAGLTATALGLYKALGPIAAGIALVVGGLAMLVTGFHDADENGWNLQNTLVSMAGILATGLGIGILVNSWLPLLIAGIASVLLAITVATGHGEELIAGVKQFLQGFIDFFVGIFTGDIERAVGGIENIFAGLKIAIGAIMDGIRDFFLAFLDWIDEKTNGRFHGIIEAAKLFVTDAFDSIKEGVGAFLDGLKEVFLGLIDFFTGVFTLDFDKAWQGIVKIFDGICGMLLSPFVTVINLIIDALNVLIRGMNKISFDAPDWVPGIGGKTFGISIKEIPKVKLPELAAGAVIPPNREFTAVLGDQTHGNNLEAPENLIRQIVREESGGGNYTSLLQQILQAIRDGKLMVVDGTAFAQVISSSMDTENYRRGGAMVSIQ